MDDLAGTAADDHVDIDIDQIIIMIMIMIMIGHAERARRSSTAPARELRSSDGAAALPEGTSACSELHP
jgi:hypothetical protein